METGGGESRSKERILIRQRSDVRSPIGAGPPFSLSYFLTPIPMPIYDFICRDCEKRFDLLVAYDWRAAGAICPVCGSGDLEKAVSRVGAFQSGGKISMLDEGHNCSSCATGTCSTCH